MKGRVKSLSVSLFLRERFPWYFNIRSHKVTLIYPELGSGLLPSREKNGEKDLKSYAGRGTVLNGSGEKLTDNLGYAVLCDIRGNIVGHREQIGR
jgi:hypothetical protein